jgi:hypothetical protein
VIGVIAKVPKSKSLVQATRLTRQPRLALAPPLLPALDMLALHFALQRFSIMALFARALLLDPNLPPCQLFRSLNVA